MKESNKMIWDKINKDKLIKYKYLIMSIVVAITVLSICAVIFLFHNSSESEVAVIHEQPAVSYEECVQYGGVIQKSFPQKCVLENGDTFVRILTIAELTQLARQMDNPIPDKETPSMELGANSGIDEGDVADDIAIWFNKDDPANSLVIADNKGDEGGVVVYDLKGNQLQFLQIGSVGNIDVRDDFMHQNSSIPIVAAVHRGNNSLIVFRIDTEKLRLEELPNSTTALGYEPYGLCLFKSPNTGEYYAFVNPRRASNVTQYKLVSENDGITAQKIDRNFGVTSLSEGCVADDESGHVYIAQEDVGLWKYDAEPDGGDKRIKLDTNENGGASGYDLEGVGVSYGSNGSGFIFVSRQGSDSFAMYERSSNKFVKEFVVLASDNIDKTTSTDGLDVIYENLGPDYPYGLLVVHDGENQGGATSNLKFIPLERVTGNRY